jgi:hypothetical protein
MSVGASAPRATRPRAFRATSPTATHLPVFRHRPSGTNVYRITTSDAVKNSSWIEGMAQPPQPSPITTPNGRGRRATAASTSSASKLTSWATISRTIRCRKRRRTSRATISP